MKNTKHLCIVSREKNKQTKKHESLESHSTLQVFNPILEQSHICICVKTLGIPHTARFRFAIRKTKKRPLYFSFVF